MNLGFCIKLPYQMFRETPSSQCYGVSSVTFHCGENVLIRAENYRTWLLLAACMRTFTILAASSMGLSEPLFPLLPPASQPPFYSMRLLEPVAPVGSAI